MREITIPELPPESLMAESGSDTGCGIKCSECESEPHHWMPDLDGEDAVAACKHCDHVEPMSDEIEELLFDGEWL